MIPTDLRYNKEHEWVRLEGDVATLGITDHAQKALGDIVFVDLPAAGQSLTAGQAFCAVESVKAASDCYMPVAGSIAEVNSALADSPETVNGDPYGAGWLVKVKVADKAAFDSLMTAAEYEKFLAESEQG